MDEISKKKDKAIGKKKGGVHFLTRKERDRRKRDRHLAAYWRRWRRLHPEQKTKGEVPL